MRAGISHRVHRYEHDPAVGSYGDEAARALGVEAARVFKTLVASGAHGLVVAVIPTTTQLDLKALAAASGTKRLDMADPAAAERSSGYVVGGISPIAQTRRLPTYVDASASSWATIFVSGGRRGLEVELSCDDLVHVTGATLAAISRPR